MSAQPSHAFDPSRRFVRIVDEREDGMVEFEFAVGEPELFVEMILPQAAFIEFCAREQVLPTRSDGQAIDPADGRHWTLREARTQRLDRHTPGTDPEPPA
ncbi:MAG: phenol hydroxylase [Burkholderiales bacterium]|nr:phenol hydroxylase [Burkholderiales bacterium]